MQCPRGIREPLSQPRDSLLITGKSICESIARSNPLFTLSYQLHPHNVLPIHACTVNLQEKNSVAIHFDSTVSFKMSFGVSISDIITVISLAKDTVQHCRHAPSDFAEASRVSQSLYLMLEGVKTEYQNLDSALHKVERTRTDFAIHFKNCERSLKPLAELIVKHNRLGSSSIRIIDRARFPKKDYLEYRSNLAFYTARLSEFLQMVGLGSLGRIEQKIEGIKGDLPIVMSKIDQMCAEFRIMGDRESLLSDHTDDEKFVWKTFRSKLNEAGFTSNVLREHEAAIFLRIRELTKCGLLDTDGSSSLWTSDETLIPPRTVQESFRPNPRRAYAESDADSEKTISPKPSVKNLRPGESSDFGPESLPEKVDSDPLEQRRNSRENTVSGTSPLLVHDDDQYDNVPHTEIKSSSVKPRVWRNEKGVIILKGILSAEISRSGQSFVAIVDSSKQEVLIPLSNLSEVDLAYINRPIQRAAVENEKATVEKDESIPKYPAAPKKASDVDDSKDKPIDLPPRTRPSILVGKRKQMLIRWAFREKGSRLPQNAPYRSRQSLTNDLLPKAASRGDLKRVKKLLASGQHIESKGPESWSEQVKGPSDPYGGATYTTVEHTYPETTALYRAAQEGWFEIVHFLIGQGADVNTKNRQGDPILFDVIENGDEKIARLLLEYEAKSKSDGTTALHIACSYPTRALVRLVLDYGAYIDAKDPSGQTPLYLATVGNFPSIVKLLLEEGARPNIIISGRRTALYKSGDNDTSDIVELLLRYGADPDLGYGRLGETKIYKAAWYNRLELVELLLQFGADVNIRNRKLMESYKGVREKVVHGILSGLSKEHAVMNAWGKGALHAAAYQGYEEMVQVLLSAGADFEAVGNDGTTPLYLAAQQKHRGVVQILLKAGAQLQTERHDPVLALLDEHNKKKSSRSKELIRKNDHGVDMIKIGTTDLLVGLVADLTKTWSSSRRLGHQ